VNQCPLGVDKLPASLGEFAPSISLGERNSELSLKLVVNRLVVEDNGVGFLVWLALGVGERRDRDGHPAGHHPVVGRAPSCVGDPVRSAGHHADAKDGSGWLTSRNQLDLTVPAVYLFRMLLRTRQTPPGFIEPCLPSAAEHPPSGSGWLIGTAAAGPCATEIENVTKLLASRDSGAGPTAGPVGTTTGQHPPTSAMGAADSSTAASAAAAESAKAQHPPTAAMNQATQGRGASPRASDTVREQHPPTAAMNEATHGGAASPQDVQSQNRGGPTAAQQAEGARRPASERLASAQNALEQARDFDRSGQETQCMDAIARVKRLVH
jgi:hypothetical protein